MWRQQVVRNIGDTIKKDIEEELKKPLWMQWTNILLGVSIITFIYLWIIREHILYFRLLSGV